MLWLAIRSGSVQVAVEGCPKFGGRSCGLTIDRYYTRRYCHGAKRAVAVARSLFRFNLHAFDAIHSWFYDTGPAGASCSGASRHPPPPRQRIRKPQVMMGRHLSAVVVWRLLVDFIFNKCERLRAMS